MTSLNHCPKISCLLIPCRLGRCLTHSQVIAMFIHRGSPLVARRHSAPRRPRRVRCWPWRRWAMWGPPSCWRSCSRSCCWSVAGGYGYGYGYSSCVFFRVIRWILMCFFSGSAEFAWFNDGELVGWWVRMMINWWLVNGLMANDNGLVNA